MYAIDYYFSKLLLRSKERNKPVLKKCKCGKMTYQSSGVCVCCNLNLEKLAKEI